MSINTIHPVIDDGLLFRRQFFLGPKYVEHLNGWQKTEINSDYFITSHPDLDITCHNIGNTKLILLGFILDPDNPTFGNEEIIIYLLAKDQSFESILRNTDRYSGRWVLIHLEDGNIKLFTDAAGLRSVFYHFGKETVWCASQPHTIAELLNIEKRDNAVFLEFIYSKEFEKNERTLFGDDTYFKNIFHLLPNHYLSIKDKFVKRYWPYKIAEEKKVQQTIGEVAPIIKGLYQSANNRYKLIQPVTAGRDSRLLLAASKNVSQNIYYFIQKFKGINRYSREIRIPNKLLKYLNLEFHIEKCGNYNNEFDRYLRKNVFTLQTDWKKILHYNFFSKFQGYLNISGNYTGIYRPFKWQVFAPPNTPLINRTFGRYFRKFKYVDEFINNWEKLYDEELKKFKYPIYDIFYWENKAANWVSMFVNELDIAIEEWCPLNNRKILEAILSIKPENRINENFQQQIVEYLWPDALKLLLAKVGEDKPYKIHYKKILYELLKKIGLLNIIKTLYNKFNY